MKTLADQVFVISLPERTDRRERISALLQREDVPFQFADGVRVRREEIADLEISQLGWAQFKVAGGWDAYLQAAVGCKRAHIHCLESAREAGFGSVLILEDDMAFREHWFSTFQQAIDQLPEGWLQLYLSAGNYWRQPRPVSSHLARLVGACQTTAILYSREGMEAALACARSCRAEIDMWFAWHLHPFGCSYLVTPQITHQTGGYSDCRSGWRGEMP